MRRWWIIDDRDVVLMSERDSVTERVHERSSLELFLFVYMELIVASRCASYQYIESFILSVLDFERIHRVEEEISQDHDNDPDKTAIYPAKVCIGALVYVFLIERIFKIFFCRMFRKSLSCVAAICVVATCVYLLRKDV